MASWLGWGTSTEEDSSSGGELTAEEEESQKIHSTSELKEMCKNKEIKTFYRVPLARNKEK